MNRSFYRRDRTNQEMDSCSLTLSVFLLSLIFMQFVSAEGQIRIRVKAEAGRKVPLPCEDPDQGKIEFVEWKRTGLGSKYVLLYRGNRIATDGQDPSYKDRVDLDVDQLNYGDASLILKNVTIADSGTYECRFAIENIGMKNISTVNLDVVFPPEPFPVWAKVLLVLLVLVLAAPAGVLFYLWHHWKPDQQVVVKSGTPFVRLDLKVPPFLWFCIFRRSVDKVEWKDRDNRTVHVYQNGSYQPGKQDRFYKDRTKMDENLLKTGDLSLTLSWPTDGDGDSFTCRVSSRKGDVLMEKQVWLKVKAQEQVEVEPGVESVKLPCRTTESLDGDDEYSAEYVLNDPKVEVESGVVPFELPCRTTQDLPEDVRVEWMDRKDRTVHVYQDGSDHPGEQDRFCRTRTKTDKNLLETGDLSPTPSTQSESDEYGTIQVLPDIRTRRNSIDPTPLIACQ